MDNSDLYVCMPLHVLAELLHASSGLLLHRPVRAVSSSGTGHVRSCACVASRSGSAPSTTYMNPLTLCVVSRQGKARLMLNLMRYSHLEQEQAATA